MLNKKERELLNNYKYARETGVLNIYDAYANPSQKKRDIYRKLEEWRDDENGFDRAIPTHNSRIFTYAFKRGDGRYGEVELVYVTPTNVYTFPIDE